MLPSGVHRKLVIDDDATLAGERIIETVAVERLDEDDPCHSFPQRVVEIVQEISDP